jgi:hypothetical protein
MHGPACVPPLGTETTGPGHDLLDNFGAARSDVTKASRSMRCCRGARIRSADYRRGTSAIPTTTLTDRRAIRRRTATTLPFTIPRPQGRSHERSHEAFASQLARERSEAVGLVAWLLRDTSRADIPTLAEHPELRTFGAHEQLISTASTELTRDPQYALLLAQLAVSLAKRLPLDGYHDVTRTQARAYAWGIRDREGELAGGLERGERRDPLREAGPHQLHTRYRPGT